MFAAIKKFRCKKCNVPISEYDRGKEISNSYSSENDGKTIQITCTWCGAFLAIVQRRALNDDRDFCSTTDFFIYSCAYIDNKNAEEY